MSHHACFALPPEFLDIVVVDDSKPMQGILRSMLAGLRARRIRMFDDIRDALESMLGEPPNLVITDWRVGNYSGHQLLKMMRSPNLAPLCYVPVIVITAHATQSVVDKVMRDGAHLLLVKPVAPSTLIDRILWLTSDSRRFVANGNQNLMIEGVAEKIRLQQGRMDVIKKARAFHEESRRGEVKALANAKREIPSDADSKPARSPRKTSDANRPATRSRESAPFGAINR